MSVDVLMCNFFLYLQSACSNSLYLPQKQDFAVIKLILGVSNVTCDLFEYNRKEGERDKEWEGRQKHPDRDTVTATQRHRDTDAQSPLHSDIDILDLLPCPNTHTLAVFHRSTKILVASQRQGLRTGLSLSIFLPIYISTKIYK